MCAWLGRHGWSEIHHNLICFHVQLDIIARSPAGVLTILEVKMQSPLRLAHVPFKQKERLFRAAEVLAQSEPVQIKLVLIEPSHVQILPVEAF